MFRTPEGHGAQAAPSSDPDHLGPGHPTSCLSCADIVAALFFREMRWDPSDPTARNVDYFVLSKGHAAPILWAALSEAHAIAEDPLSLRRIDSTLEGHPTPNNPWIKVATGSLGQGLAAANGMAADARWHRCPYLLPYGRWRVL
jgi:transketolase